MTVLRWLRAEIAANEPIAMGAGLAIAGMIGFNLNAIVAAIRAVLGC